MTHADTTTNLDRLLSSYDYDLPLDRIAQNPVVPRDSARLLVVDSPTTHQHRIFRDLPELLRPHDLLVLNDTRVIPARLYGRKSNGVEVEVLLLEEQQVNQWLALVKPGKRLKPGAAIEFGDGWVQAVVQSVDRATGGRILKFDVPEGKSLLQVLPDLGVVPLPPYITQAEIDPEQYQTVYAAQPGAVAAPTAGLHFTPDLLDRLREQGIDRAFVTLHTGIGTFRPVEVEDITTHPMHGEWLEVPKATVERIEQARSQGGRIIAVGTTVIRALEGAAAESGKLEPFCGKTNLFIYPGFEWRVIDGLITNFHLPKSSLMMLVSALIGRSRLLALYEEAIREKYRFYSFGDATLILPEARLTAS
ncbi:tRNA preQ1(34) S-adenosylmethionine ribosyltransferase-isomerase QueA [Microcoleus sp. FACHB-1515]|uniref:tRNA preQ1(34) S-adenosylmethionine ribosyltransferase-isomerase QueA n=1 Tax=Cyanophyceae TaxID=3028117 RepID=UPI0016887496|nr:tRNA preQ1(34) S-adenosylmethionine ribosyltransferase-isomerase QueA [Microcoleus sp. FACHB-1515]MBD2091679.1 tRNA preQ1(34) S-adenosylmethionine ribosyltransferase-isomerase QueA [Microcoleus sp. FACHB-1515]